MISSYNFLALKLNHLVSILENIPKVFKVERKHRDKYVLCYRYTDKNGKRHEYSACTPMGQKMEHIFNMRASAETDLLKWKSVWKNTFLAPVPALDLPAMHRISRSIITKEFYDSLIPCQNPKPIIRPNPYKGIVFRSKSEREIAEILDELGIEYKYEPSIPVNNYEIYGDFVCFIRELGFGFIIEHCGMMDSPAYVDKTIRTFRDYNSLGFLPGVNILYTYERNDCPPPLNYFRAQISALLDTFCAP